MIRILFLFGLSFATCFGAKSPPPDFKGVTETQLWIPMRDGIRLYALLYRPQEQKKLPVIFELRYTDIDNNRMRQDTADKARAGFAVVNVVWRGSGKSEGVYTGYRSLALNEHHDAYDVCEWLAAQSWSTGKVGSYGGSQGAYAQNFLAAANPPHLVCQYMVDTGLSLFHNSSRVGGTTRPERDRELVRTAARQSEYEAFLRTRDEHPNYDEYWRGEDTSRHFGNMNVPCFSIASWYDGTVQATLASYIGRQHQGGPAGRGRQQLIVGPWRHGKGTKTSHVEELDYPANAGWPEHEHLVRWFNYWLKGEANGIEKEPAVRYYVMGASGEAGAPGNAWREAKDWPVPSTPTRMYLQNGGRLAAAQPTIPGKTTFTSDPKNPPTVGGKGYSLANDARPFESHRDVRTWTTDELTQPVEWTGDVSAEMWLSSTALDTDLVVRVSDVYPDGRSMLLVEQPLRARYREGFDHQVLLKPGQPVLLKWRVGCTSIVFNRGHRIRVTVASAAMPNFEPNNQTGGPQTHDWMKDTFVAENTLWHDAKHPSCLVAPVREK